MSTARAAAVHIVYRLCGTVRRWGAALALLAFQVVPVGVKHSDAGRLDIGVGVGGDRYLQQSFDCDNNVVRQRALHSVVVSAVVDYMATEQLRISAFAGHSRASIGACTSVNPNENCELSTPFSGAFGGAEIAYERGKAAFGLGLTTVPDREVYEGLLNANHTSLQQLRPSLHARFGNRESHYIRLDLFTARVPGEVPMSTLGIGFGRPGFHSERGFIGIGVLPYQEVGKGLPAVLVGNGALPILHLGDIVAGGYIGAGQAAGVSIGARVHARGGR